MQLQGNTGMINDMFNQSGTRSWDLLDLTPYNSGVDRKVKWSYQRRLTENCAVDRGID